jgi:peptidoglycan/xylan/chitin deacetylase (PgdA/CDA1 family)
MLKHSLFRAALDLIALTQAPRWLPDSGRAAGFVLTLHHVAPTSPATFTPNDVLWINPDFLDRLLGHLAAGGWRFVPVDAILTASGGPADRRRVAITLDDGYRDNLEYALPIFQKHRAPFTIFVCPGFSDRTAELWWEALERIIVRERSIPAPGEGGAPALPTGSDAEKVRAFFVWRHWLMQVADEAAQRQAIRALALRYGLDLVALAEELVMDWSDVRRIAADPLCTIGAHTMTHPALGRLPEQAARTEIADSVDRIAAEIGRRPTTLAFPYGMAFAAGPREAALAAAAGLRGSFTTSPGYIPASGSRHGLPRVSVNGLFQEPRYLDALLTPGLWDLRDRIRRGR